MPSSPCLSVIALATLLYLAVWPTHAADWPHWRGPTRNDISAEPSHYTPSKRWPPGDAAWRVSVGEGSTSPLVVGDKLYTMGWSRGQDSIICLDARTGKEQWRVSYGCPRYGRVATGDQGFYRGPSGTPEYDAATGYLYTLSTDGDLRCTDTNARGKTVWSLNLYERYRMPQRPQVTRRGGSRRDYGYTTAPLVHGDTVIVEVGDDEGTLMGFDKRTGRRVWASQCKQPAGHSGGPMPMTVEGVPCVAVLTARSLLVARLDKGREGQTVGEYPWVTDFINNIPTPTVHGSDVLVTSKYNVQAMARLRVTLRGITKVWQIKEASGVCSPVIHKGKVYFANRGVYCIDYATGEVEWDGGRFLDPGSIIVTSDDRLIVWGNKGDLALVDTFQRSRNEYREVASRKNVMRSYAWPHVVLANGLLYCKDRDGNLACFDVRGE